MAGAERAGEPHGRRRSARRRQRAVSDGSAAVSADGRAASRQSSDERPGGRRRAVATYARANPQVIVLLVICLVLGLGTFLAVVFGLLTAGSGQTTGEPSGAILGVHLLAPATRSLTV